MDLMGENVLKAKIVNSVIHKLYHFVYLIWNLSPFFPKRELTHNLYFRVVMRFKITYMRLSETVNSVTYIKYYLYIWSALSHNRKGWTEWTLRCFQEEKVEVTEAVIFLELSNNEMGCYVKLLVIYANMPKRDWLHQLRMP